jgi:hypothetical protein
MFVRVKSHRKACEVKEKGGLKDYTFVKNKASISN